jgi:serine/threonine-protein kinase SRPK3
MLTLALLDLQARNVYLRIEDNSILREFEAAELSTLSTRKVDRDRVIYKSRRLIRPKRHGRLILCDFSEARFGKKTYTNDIQPYVY